MPSLQQRYFPWIEPLRALAALAVLLVHVIYGARWIEFPNTGLLSVFRYGAVGVDLFLVISGFVVTLLVSNLRQRAHNGDGRNDGKSVFRTFMIGRVARIAPLYWLTGIVFLVVIDHGMLMHGTGSAIAQLVSHAFFLQNLHPEFAARILGVNVTVALEMQFYLVLLPMLMILTKSRLLFVVVFLVASIACRYFLWTTLPDAAARADGFVFFGNTLPFAFGHFAIGMLAADAVLRRAVFARPASAICMCWLLVSIGSLALLMFVFMTTPDVWANFFFAVVWRTLLAASFGCIVMAAATCPMSIAVVRPLAYLGEISYGLYLWHVIVIELLLRYTSLRGGAFFIAVVVTTVALSALSFRYMEQPITQWVKRRSRDTIPSTARPLSP